LYYAKYVRKCIIGSENHANHIDWERHKIYVCLFGVYEAESISKSSNKTLYQRTELGCLHSHHLIAAQMHCLHFSTSIQYAIIYYACISNQCTSYLPNVQRSISSPSSWVIIRNVAWYNTKFVWFHVSARIVLFFLWMTSCEFVLLEESWRNALFAEYLLNFLEKDNKHVGILFCKGHKSLLWVI